MSPSSAPERSIEQRMDALQNANEVRTRRAALKRDLKLNRTSFLDVLVDPPKWLESAKVFDILLAVPKYGRVKVNKILQTARVSPSKTFGGLSARQRAEIVTLVAGGSIRHAAPSDEPAEVPAPPIVLAAPRVPEPTEFQRGVLALATLEFGSIDRSNAQRAAAALRTNPGAVMRACDQLQELGLMDTKGQPTSAGSSRASLLTPA